MLLSSLFLTPILFLSRTVLADVSISKPLAGDEYTVSGDSATVALTWIESNSEPVLTEIDTYTFVICTGSNSDINGISTISEVSASSVDGYSVSLDIPADTGADGSYFIQVYATVKTGGYSIHYSPRFTLEGMTGTLTPSGGTASPPSAEVNLETSETTTMDDADKSKSFSLYYTSQTGKTRYAPMQTQPGSTVTATSWSRQYPTSAVTYYSSLKTSLDQVSTVTAGWSYTISSAQNYASPALYPSDNGGWYDPQSKVKSATLTRLTSDEASASSSSSSSSA